jgi:hypothetical protein
MAFDTNEARAGGREQLQPMQIAHNSLFTAREKIDLLNKMKAEVTGAAENGDNLGFTAEEIDEAIEEVKRGAQDGVGTATVLGGDF